MRDGFDGLSGLTPGAQAAHDNECLESMLLKQVRHPGARGFALSSTVEIDLVIVRELLDLFLQIIRFESNGSGDAL